MRKQILFLISLFMISIIQISAVSAAMYVEDYQKTYTSSAPSIATFVVQTLKYDPYPVNAGDWFDLWVKVQNVGQASAPNAEFELMPEYPFTSEENLVRAYGIIPGTINSYKSIQESDANQVIMKFRIKVADNAPVGENILKLQATTDASKGSRFTFNLPIEVGKTKTDFDVIMQDSSSTATSFAISNIGENTATAVTISIKPQENVKVSGSSSSIIGNLAAGDFTTVTFDIAPNSALKELVLQLAYTDAAGIRTTIEKIVPVDIKATVVNTGTTRTQTSSTSKYLYLGLGLALGMILLPVYKRFKKKK